MRSTLPTHLRSWVFGVGAAALVTWLAARGGGYDLVIRQTAGIVTWWVFAVLVLTGPRGSSRLHWSGRVLVGAVAGSVAWVALQLGTTISAERTVTELARASFHLSLVLLAAVAIPRDRWRAVIVGLTVAATTITALALLQRLHPGALGFTWHPWSASSPERLSFPLGYWNAVGSWSALAALLALGVSAHQPQRWARALAGAALPIAIAALYLTYSRAALGALALGLIALVVLAKHRWTLATHAAATGVASALVIGAIRAHPQIALGSGTHGATTVGLTISVAALALAAAFAASSRLDLVFVPQRHARRVILGAALLAVAVTLAAGAALGPTAWRQFNDTSNVALGTDPTARLSSLQGSRIRLWKVAISSGHDDPLRGSGAGTFELLWNQRGDTSEFVRDAHNAFLEAYAEQGLVGLALLLALVAAGVAGAVRAACRATSSTDRGLIASAGAALAAFFAGTGVDWLWEVSALAAIALLLLGAVASAGATDAPSQAHGIRPRRRAAARATLALLGVIGLLTQVPGLAATSEVRRSTSAVRAGQFDKALASADQAVETAPWASSPYVQRALVDERLGRYQFALRSLTYARRRDPQDWRIPLLSARVHAEAGNARAALTAYRLAKRLRPRGDFFPQ